MCGIAGIWDPDARSREDLLVAARRMASAMEHRGPDAAGDHLDGPAGLALAQRRLQVVDRSSAGAQPMTLGPLTLVFNGEIYNHAELRRHLDHRWRGHGDTETLLVALASWGVGRTLDRLRGMFAFALWDADARRLTLARDPVGEKPLYLAGHGNRLAFASELGPLTELPWVDTSIDHDALAAYLELTYVPAPASIHRGIRKLPAGTVATVDRRPDRRVDRQYWSLSDVAAQGLAARDTDPSTVEEVHDRLRVAVSQRLVADVPLGAFLSGGLDSSVVVALAQQATDRPVRTFTVAMDDASHDEADQAAAVAAHLGTDHTTIPLHPAAGLELVPHLPAVYGEPFGDPSALAVLLLARATRQHVTVALSGDGGDEVFGGYNRYTLGQAVVKRLAHPALAALPPGLRSTLARTAAAGLRAVPPRGWDRLVGTAAGLLGSQPPRLAGDKVHKLAGLLDVDDGDELYRRLAAAWQTSPRRPAGAPVGMPAGVGPGVAGAIDRMMLADGLRTLPDQMLAKVDRATMAASLEARVPLLDPDVIAAAWRLPLTQKVAGGTGKQVLRTILSQHVPRELWDRPKLGFDPPIGAWLRGPLRAWAEDMLSPSALRYDGLLDVALIRRTWAEHQLGRRNHDHRLWTVLMYRQWRQDRRR